MILNKIKEYYNNIKESLIESNFYYSFLGFLKNINSKYMYQVDPSTGKSKILCPHNDTLHRHIFTGSDECLNCKYCRGNDIKIFLIKNKNNKRKNLYSHLVVCDIKCCYNKNNFYKIFTYVLNKCKKSLTKYHIIKYD